MPNIGLEKTMTSHTAMRKKAIPKSAAPSVFDEEAMLSSEMRRLRENQNNFSFWFPKVRNSGILMPESLIFDVPMALLKCFYGDNPD